MPKFPGLKGAIVVQADPLAADGDWNIHINVLLLTEGRLDYGELRREWGRNLEIRELHGRDWDSLRSAVAELVKYAALAVPSKFAEKRASGQSQAPAMVEWPTECWLEWWAAQQGFRRTRSYGVLHGVPAPPTVPLVDLRMVGLITYDNGYYRVEIAPWGPEQNSLDLIPGNNFASVGMLSECIGPTGCDPSRPTRLRIAQP